MPVFIIGFMCSGKSRVGKELAGQLDRVHLDIDRVIEQRIGPITPWFQQKGEAAFREVERMVLLELLGRTDAVVSTGGGTPCEFDNMDRMLKDGTVVYLDVPLDELVRRAEQKGGDRPLLFGLKGDELRERITALLNERLPYYSRAHMRIRATDDPSIIAARIAQAVRHEPG